MSNLLGINLAELCLQQGSTGAVCVTFPGGFKLCALVGLDTGYPMEVVKHFIAQINLALAPLTPFFNIADLVKAIVDCVKAVPDAIIGLDPAKIIECIPGLLIALEKVLETCTPILVVPKMVKGILTVIVLTLSGILGEVRAIIRAEQKLARALSQGVAPGNAALKLMLDCATGNLKAELANLNAQFGPLARLMGYINTLLDLAQIPDKYRLGVLVDVGDNAEAALAPLQEFIEIAAFIADVIPVPLDTSP